MNEVILSKNNLVEKIMGFWH